MKQTKPKPLSLFCVFDSWGINHVYFNEDKARAALNKAREEALGRSQSWHSSPKTPRLEVTEKNCGYFVCNSTQWVRLETETGEAVNIGDERQGAYYHAWTPCYTLPELADSARANLARHNAKLAVDAESLPMYL